MIIEQDKVTYVRQGKWVCAILENGVTVRAKSWAALDSLLGARATERLVSRGQLWKAGGNVDEETD